jgi:dTMP kinase
MAPIASPVARLGAHGEPGVLVVLEGTDRAGRSTHTRLLEQHLRYAGRPVTRTSLASSALAAGPIRASRQGRMDPIETVLLYAADLAERIEQVIVPALRAGFVVLADRYTYTPMARAEIRGVDGAWLDRLFAFAPPPDVTFLLEVDAATALARQGLGDPDPAEAGLDLHLARDVARSFGLFQDRLHDCLIRYAPRYNFSRVDARAAAPIVQAVLEPRLDAVLAGRARLGLPGA